MLEVSYVPDYRDRFRLQRASARHLYDSSARTTITILWVLVALLIFVIGERREAIVAVIARSLGESRADALWSIGFLVFSIAAGLYLWFGVTPAIAAKALERISPPPSFKVTASNDGLLWEGSDIRYSIGWPAVRRVFTTSDAICFLVGEMIWYIPKKAFNGQDGVDTFLSYVLPRVSNSTQSGSA